MQIDSIEIYHIGLPLRQPLTTPLGAREQLETVLVALHGDGATGWGESSPGVAPLAAGEWAAGVFTLLRDWLAPAIVGQGFSSGEDLSQRLASFRGNPWAKAALDTAWWDLSARLKDQPLHQLLGGKREAIEVGPTFDRRESIDDFLVEITAAVAAGFDRLKLKFRPGWDVRMVDFVRKECPTQALHIDCEGGLGLQHMEMLYRLEDFSLAMIEQPLGVDDLVGHAMVQESLRTPLGLDEGIASLAQADIAMELHSCKYVNLKPGRVGGLTPAVAIHDLCHEHCTPCFVGAVPQSAIGGRIGFALAAKENCSYPADFFAADQVLAADVAEALLPTKDETDGRQRVRLWSTPGIGVEPDRALLEKFCIARAKIEGSVVT
jgi:O-succinylbenzoate synthase